MLLARLLISLLMAVVLSAPALAAAAAPAVVHPAAHCPHHEKEKGKPTVAAACCVPTVVPGPVTVEIAHSTRAPDRLVRLAFRLHGITVPLDPPPPRL